MKLLELHRSILSISAQKLSACRQVFDIKACTTQEIIQQIANGVHMLQMEQEEY
jgi:hypothetical protein